jgi:hypothetical protein
MPRLSTVTCTVQEVLRSTANVPTRASARLALSGARNRTYSLTRLWGTRVKLRYISQFVAKP